MKKQFIITEAQYKENVAAIKGITKSHFKAIQENVVFAMQVICTPDAKGNYHTDASKLIDTVQLVEFVFGAGGTRAKQVRAFIRQTSGYTISKDGEAKRTDKDVVFKTPRKNWWNVKLEENSETSSELDLLAAIRSLEKRADKADGFKQTPKVVKKVLKELAALEAHIVAHAE